ncbi:MAG: T9SS type A sorting domain-containing protein [bacterium]
MKRAIRVLSFLLVVLLLTGMMVEAYAQAVAVKRVAMSPGMRSSGYPNFSSPPAGTPNYVSTGLRTIPVGMLMYLKADTVGSGATKVTTLAWTFVEKPPGSNVSFSSTTKDSVTFKPDLAGRYIVQVSANGIKTHNDTLFASTYAGFTSTQASCGCHTFAVPAFQANVTTWKSSVHATIFARGMTGQLENSEGTGYKGVYTKSCFKCHTTGWESKTNNGNFGWIANQGQPASFDSTWWKGLPLAGGDYLIGYKDSTVYKMLSPALIATGSIGCETCHGPAANHATNGSKSAISVSADAGVCNQCHDSPRSHSIGYYWRESAHSNMRLSAGESNRSGCWPCHNGSAFISFTSAWSAGRATTTADSAKVDPNFKSISCAVCHDGHGNSNPYLLRYMKIDTLANGFKIPSGKGGKGQLCMNCHRGRANYATTVKNQAGRFSARFYPHYSSQADMIMGTQGWDFGMGLEGVSTHGNVKDGCVACHMSERKVTPTYTKLQGDHAMGMVENGVEKVEGCVECHGPITKFDDIKAMYDYDGNGKIDGSMTEINGLMKKLKANLPVDAAGEVIGANAVDSIAAKNWASTKKLNYATMLAAVFNYNYVKYDMSGGVHNPKYAVALLRASFGVVTNTQMDPMPIPQVYELSQNYPNPFNPTTEIRFALPKAAKMKLVVYDIMGRVVATLVNQEMSAGNHRAMWNGRTDDGKTVSSGVYIYRIEAGDFVAAKKMTLMK